MFGRKAKIKKAVHRALATVTAEADLADHAPIEALAVEHQPQAYFTLASWLVDDERYAAAKHTLDRALVIAPEEASLHQLAAAVAKELGDGDAAIAAQRRVVASNPKAGPIRVLAELLIRANQLDEAVDLLRPFSTEPDSNALRAEALFLRGDASQALALLDEVCTRYESQLREPWSVTDRQGLIARAGDARRLRQDVYAELHGREATIELAAAAGQLDARAGVNYRLLGARLAAQSARVADVVELQDPDTTEQRGRAAGPHSAAGLALVGSAQLRRGELAAARKSFDRACELDGRCFAAFFGLGAVLDHDKYQLHRRAATLPLPRQHATLVEVVPDWSALTELECQVVWAAVQPFSTRLARLAERGVTMRVLPIDARATDVSLFEHIAGKRARDDQRSYDAIQGVATQRGAIAKVEGLLDVASDHGWTFAHEFAHLAYFHMDEADTAPFTSLFDRATAIGYATTTYALKNDDELFAVTYVDYLRRRYGLATTTIADDAGIQDALMSYFTALCSQ